MSKGVGVYVGQNEIIAVSVTSSPQLPRIKSYVIEPIVGDEASEVSGSPKGRKSASKMSPTARAIHAALGKIKEPDAYVNVAVSPSHVVTRYFSMPAVPKKEESKAVPYEASRYLPFKLSELVLDYKVLEASKNSFAVTATAIKRDVLYQTLNDLRSGSAKVLMVEPVYSALSRAFGVLNFLQKVQTVGFAIVQSDGNVNLTFADKGIVCLSHDFFLGGAVEEDKKRFHEELRSSMDFFYKMTGGKAIQQVFLAGHGDLKFWIEHLEQEFNYSVRFDFANFQAEKDIPQDVLNAILVAYGLAIRSLNYRSPLGEIRLLPFEEGRSKPEQLALFLGGIVAIIFGIFLAIRFFVFQPVISNLEAENALILGPGSGIDPIIAAQPAEALSKEQIMLKSRIKTLNDFAKKKNTVAVIFSALGQGLPQSMWLDTVALEELPGQKELGKIKTRLTLRGLCYLGSAEKEAVTVNSWVKSLGGKKAFVGNFSEIKLDEIKRTTVMEHGMTRFRVVCE